MDKKKVLKIVLIIIMAIVIIFAIWFIRKFMIISKIAKASEKWKNATNFSLEIEQESILSKYSYKDGKYLFTMNNKEADGTIKEGVVCWYDDETKESITIDKLSNYTTVTTDESKYAMQGFGWEPNPNVIAENNFISKTKAVFEYTLKTEEIDGKECYTVMSKYTDTKQCHDKESGLPTKIITNARSEDKTNKSYISYKNWKFDEVTDADVERPDLTGYNVTE